MESIFQKENRSAGFGISWKYKVKGDRIEGTVIDKRMATTEVYGKPGQFEDKMAYELLVRKGTVVKTEGQDKNIEEDEKWVVWGKPEGRSGIDAQMKDVSVGQIVGFEYVGDKPNRRYPANPTKLVDVYKNRKFLDKEWLENGAKTTVDSNPDEYEEEEHEIPDFINDNSGETPAPAESDVPFTDSLSEILKLAKEKFNVATDDEAKAKTMEATDLAFTKTNYDKILAALKAL